MKELTSSQRGLRRSAERPTLTACNLNIFARGAECGGATRSGRCAQPGDPPRGYLEPRALQMGHIRWAEMPPRCVM